MNGSPPWLLLILSISAYRIGNLMVYSDESWKPTTIERIGRSEATSTGVTQVLTDCGWAYCKPLGNRQGEHALASEWVCLMLARWLGLSTFRAAIIDLDEDVTFPLPDHKGHKYHAKAGPCFITENTPGRKWDRTCEDLDRLINRDDIEKLIVFDTWVLNRDRHFPDYSVRKPNHGNVYSRRCSMTMRNIGSWQWTTRTASTTDSSTTG